MTSADVAEVAESEVEDEAYADEYVPNVPYDITSYGSDLDVEGLVRRIDREEILIPPFQRNYVWKMPEASRFIESLLLGLPVPGVFFARERETGKFLVIDGQQRLKTLQFFRHGFFDPKPGERKQRVFTLVDVDPQFEGKTYATLEEPERIRLDSSIIHATVVRQDSPPSEDTSIFHIFERLNSSGRKLTPQEIRCAIYHGRLISLLNSLNENTSWREVYGKPSARLKDQELILRFMALFLESELYERPMVEFLNKFSGRHRDPDDAFVASVSEAFGGSIELVHHALGKRAFRRERALNAALFDSVMVGLARRRRREPAISLEGVAKAYESLLTDAEFQERISRSTSDVAFVKERIAKATTAFEAI